MNFINQRKSSLLTRYIFKLVNLNKNENLIKKSYFKKELSTNCSKINNFTNHGSILIYKLNNNSINNSIKLSNLRFNTTQSSNKNADATKSNPFAKLEIDLEEDKEREKERDRLRKRQVKVTRITLYVFCGIFTGFIGWALLNWGMPKKDEDGNEIIDRFSQYSQPKQIILRTWDELVNLQDSFNNPSRELLLPEPLTYPYMQPPYTLVIELKSLLVHFDWDYQTGWSAKTRPFLKKFLEQVGPPHFEVVIFTELSPTTAIGILEGIDKEGYIMHRLYKDSTRFIRGKHIKDLNVLNRDLAKTIQIEVDRDACSLNQRNCLVLDKWKGDTTDTALIDLAVFLRTIASQNVEDVRDIISHYSQFDKPLDVFKKNQLRMVEEEEKRHKRSQSLASSLASSVKKRI